MTTVVITHPKMGIYLGSCMGLGIWSMLDPAGQDAAVTFPSEAAATRVITTWESNGDPAAYRFEPVACAGPYAEIPELVAAGLAPLMGAMLPDPESGADAPGG